MTGVRSRLTTALLRILVFGRSNFEQIHRVVVVESLGPSLRRNDADAEIVAVIPEPSDQNRHRHNKGSRGGRAVAFNPAKSCAGLRTNYDKPAVVYRGEVMLAPIMLWLALASETHPWSTGQCLFCSSEDGAPVAR
jgi:hypothetical protein